MQCSFQKVPMWGEGANKPEDPTWKGQGGQCWSLSPYKDFLGEGGSRRAAGTGEGAKLWSSFPCSLAPPLHSPITSLDFKSSPSSRLPLAGGGIATQG